MKEEQKGTPWVSQALALLRPVAVALALAVLLLPFQPAARAASVGGDTVERTVIPLGRAVGIKLFSDGVMVVGLSEIPTEQGTLAPAKAGGLREGDIITHINSEEVDTIEEVQDILQSVGEKPLSVRAMRGDKLVQVTVQCAHCASDDSYKLGAWIRDSMAGIGTLTFYDPASGVFGALGHGVSDVDTALLMPLQSGAIMYAEVDGVKKGVAGSPGELHGQFRVSQDMGDLYANTHSGIFGDLTDESLAGDMRPMAVAARSEVKTGEATILSNIAGDTVEEYKVEIVRIYPENSNDTRNLMLKVTDPRLLETTGGIVQGMSGSPILQNGKLVGAVTHVLVNDPTSGYGILAENMLDAAAESKSASLS